MGKQVKGWRLYNVYNIYADPEEGQGVQTIVGILKGCLDGITMSCVIFLSTVKKTGWAP